MAYITEDYYLNDYKGQPTEDDLSALIERASDTVDCLTAYAVGDIDSQPEHIARLIKKAVAAQVEFMDANGGLAAFNDGGVSSCTIGKFSYTAGGSYDGASSSRCSPAAVNFLEHTGLLYRGL